MVFSICGYLLLFGLVAGRNYCPVTSTRNVSSTGYLPYPYLYWSNSPLPKKEETAYNCTVRKIIKQSTIGYCYPDRPCVITTEEVTAAVQVQKWEAKMDAICSLEKFRRNEHYHHHADQLHKVNLVIIGGSMTAGSGTGGECFCIHSDDSRCPDVDRTDVPLSFCSWPTQFTNWIVQEFPNVQFNILNLAHGGLASEIVPTYIAPFFQNLTLSNQDIVLIDESVNDVGKPYNTLAHSVELMIRRIYSFSDGTLPTIIMIEQYPHRSHRDGELQKTQFDNRILPGDYSIIYRSLSERYSFVYYSLREVYWTYFNPKINQEKKYPFSPFNEAHFEAHPPWYFHMFAADIIANCFLYSLSRCSHSPSSFSNSSNSSSHSSSNSSLQDLPPPVVNNLLTNEDYCDPKHPFLLNAHPTNYFTPKNLTDYESDPTHQYGWREYADYHNISGWIITDQSNPSLRTLSFPLHSNQDYNGSYEDLLIIILYLKSYVGMGIVEIEICNIKSDESIDGIFPNYRTNHVSIPQAAFYHLTSLQITSCLKLSPEERRISLIYRPDIITTLDHIRHHKKMKILDVECCLRSKN